MAGQNPTIIATITAEDKTQAAIATATAALREMNKAIKAVGNEKLPDNMLGGLDRELSRATQQMTALKDKTSQAKREVFSLRDAFGEAMRNMRPLVELSTGMHLEHFGIETAKKAGEYSHAEILNAYAGMTPDQLALAERETLEAQKRNPNLSMISGQHLAGSLYSVMADNHEAEQLFPKLMDYRALERARNPHESEEQIDERVHNTLKFGETIGANASAASLGRLLDKITKVENFEGKMIRPEDLLGLSKQAGAALKLLSDAGQKTAVQLVAEWGGDRTGTFLSAVQKYSAGSGFDNHASALMEMAAAGLLDKNDLIMSKGKPVGIKQGTESLARLQKLSADPLAYMNQDMSPAIERLWDRLSDKQRKTFEDEFRKNYANDVANDPSLAIHDKTGKAIDPSQMDAKQVFALGEIRRLFPNAVAARGMGELFVQMQQFLAKSEKIDNAKDVAGTLEQSKKDPVAQMQAFQTALGNLQTVLGSPLMDKAAESLNGLAHTIAGVTSSLAEFEKNHPDAAKALAGVAIGGSVVGGGALVSGVLGNFMNGFGLKESAVALDRAAAHLMGVPSTGGMPGAPASAVPPAKGPNGNGLVGNFLGFMLLEYGEQAIDAALETAFGKPGKAGDEWGGMSEFDRIKKTWTDIGHYLPKIAPPGEVQPNPNDPAVMKRAQDAEDAFRRDPEAARGRSRLELDARTARAGVNVKGDVSGEVQLHQTFEVRASPLLEVRLNRIDNLTIPLAGKLGETSIGPSGTRYSRRDE